MATTYVDQISGSGSSPTPVDPITGGGETVAYKAPCRLATTGNVTLDGLQAIDGETTAAGDRVLVRAQTDQKQNGIWIAAAGAWQRARDFDSNRDITKGTRVTVTDGSTLAGKEYQIASENPISVGTSNITFTETLSSDAGSSAAAAQAAQAAAEVAQAGAEGAETAASGYASAASTSAGNAATSESNAASSAGDASDYASAALALAGAASTSAGNAVTAETNAETAEANAEAAQAAAELAQAAAEAAASSIDTATLLNRANHTGTQLAATISDCSTAVHLVLGGAPGSAALKNTGTSGDAVQLLSSANTWSATQTFESADDGAGLGPAIDVYRNSASPETFENLGEVQFNGEDAAGNKVQYAGISAFTGGNIGAGTHGGGLNLYSALGGALVQEISLFFGVVLGAASGGAQGAGTVNATAFYDDGNRLPYRLEGTATFDPSNLADGAGATTTVTVTGAALGDMALASFSLNTQGITITAWVSAANTVSVRFQNESGGALDIGSTKRRSGARRRSSV